MSAPAYGDRVFLNVPFDKRYRALLEALVFAVHDCGFVARCALESDDGTVKQTGFPDSTCLSNSGCFSELSALEDRSSAAKCA